MGSGSEASSLEALSVSGRCKPMRVEKPKKKRQNKVKQGTPPKLSGMDVGLVLYNWPEKPNPAGIHRVTD